MIQSRQRLSDRLAIGSCFKPAHTGDRVLCLIFGERSQLPSSRSRPSCRVPKAGNGILPEQLISIVDELMSPIISNAVASGIDKSLELTIRHLEFVDEKIRQLHDLDWSHRRRVLGYEHGAGRNGTGNMQPD